MFGGNLALHRLAILGIGGTFGGGAFPVLLGVLVLAVLVVAFGIFAFGIFVRALVAVGLISQSEMAQHGAGEAGKGLLIPQGAQELLQIAPGLGFDGGPPQIDGRRQ